MRAQLLWLLTLSVLSFQAVLAQGTPDESKVIEKIRLLGGRVERDDKLPGRPVVGISFEGSQRLKGGSLPLLTAFQNLKQLDLSGTAITDAGLKKLPALKKLVELNLYETSVTPAGLAELRESSPKLLIFDEFAIADLGGKVERDEKLAGPRIIGVSFAGSGKFSDQSMRLLKPLKSLTTLILCDTKLTDVGLKEIGEFKKLGFLNLRETRITDAGLIELRELKGVQRLDLRGTKITDEGVKQFKEFVPKPGIVR